MRHVVLLGRFTGDIKEEPHVIYCGLDGTKSVRLAQDACQTGKYQHGGKIIEIRNASGRPFPVIPAVSKPAPQQPQQLPPAEAAQAVQEQATSSPVRPSKPSSVTKATQTQPKKTQ